MFKSTLVLLFFMGYFFVSCNKEIEYPNEPVIEFVSIDTTLKYFRPIGSVKDSVEVTLNFTDGDGDLGLPKDSTNNVRTANFFYTPFYKKNGVWTELKALPPFPQGPLYAWIPTLNKTGKNKALKGIIKIAVSEAFSNNSKKDTMRLEIYVKDNAGNKSNVITTSEVRGLQN